MGKAVGGDLRVADERAGDCKWGARGEEVRRLIASAAIAVTESEGVRA